MKYHLPPLAALVTCLLMVGCEQPTAPKPPEPKPEAPKLEETNLTRIDETPEVLPVEPKAMRNVCTHCGGWIETDHAVMFAATVASTNPASPAENPTSDPGKARDAFFTKHLKGCGPQGGTIRTLFPEDAGWAEVDTAKREN